MYLKLRKAALVHFTLCMHGWNRNSPVKVKAEVDILARRRWAFRKIEEGITSKCFWSKYKLNIPLASVYMRNVHHHTAASVCVRCIFPIYTPARGIFNMYSFSWKICTIYIGCWMGVCVEQNIKVGIMQFTQLYMWVSFHVHDAWKGTKSTNFKRQCIANWIAFIRCHRRAIILMWHV